MTSFGLNHECGVLTVGVSIACVRVCVRMCTHNRAESAAACVALARSSEGTVMHGLLGRHE